MIKFIRNIPWKEVLVIALLAALGIGAIVGISAAITEKQKTVSSLSFERGAIDEDGLFIKSERSIYTKNYIECQGLEITPDFEATGTYQVFYYDTNKLLLGATPVMDARSTAPYKKGSDFHYAKYCRIVITPEVPVDEDGYADEDWKINFFEVAGIAGKFTIKVNKQQKNVGSEDLFESATLTEGKIFAYDTNTKAFSESTMSGYNYAKIDVIHIGSLKLIYETEVGSLSYGFFDSDDCYISGGEISSDTKFTINVPANSEYFCLIYKAENVPVINTAS